MAIEAAAQAAVEAGVVLRFHLLDSLEAINQRILHRLPADDAQDRVGELLLKLIRRVPGGRWGPLGPVRLSEMEAHADFQETYAEVRRTYDSNPSFASECDAQVFRNLHPRLKRIGVKNKRHPIVEELADYIVKELALKLHLLRTDSYVVEYGWSPDMGVWQSMLAGKFLEFPAVPVPPRFFTVASQVPVPCQVRLRNLSFCYGAARQRFGGIRNVSMEAAGISALLGPSGSYKTTLLKLIAGHLEPSSGSVEIDGEDVTRKPAESRRVATVFQGYALFPHLTALENVMEGARLRPEFSDKDRRWLADAYLRRLKVEHCRDRLPAHTSGGEQQRIAIARALMAEPKVLLMDEPTGALDGIQRESLAAMLKQISEASPGLTIVIVSHDRDFVFSMGAALNVIDNGTIVASGQISDLLSSPPNLRTAEILQTHSILRGVLREDGSFSPDGGSDGTLTVINPPQELVGRKCAALVPHHAVGVMAPSEKAECATLQATLTEITNSDGSIRLVVETASTWRITAVVAKSIGVGPLQPGSPVVVTIDPAVVRVVAIKDQTI